MAFNRFQTCGFKNPRRHSQRVLYIQYTGCTTFSIHLFFLLHTSTRVVPKKVARYFLLFWKKIPYVDRVAAQNNNVVQNGTTVFTGSSQQPSSSVNVATGDANSLGPRHDTDDSKSISIVPRNQDLHDADGCFQTIINATLLASLFLGASSSSSWWWCRWDAIASLDDGRSGKTGRTAAKVHNESDTTGRRQQTRSHYWTARRNSPLPSGMFFFFVIFQSSLFFMSLNSMLIPQRHRSTLYSSTSFLGT